MMDAIGIVQPGGPDMLQLEQRPIPHPGEDEILIEVIAAGVNRPDVLQRMGLYAPPAGASDIPGLEVSGRVDRVGRDVKRWAVGDLSLIHISEPTRLGMLSRMPSSA